MPQQLAGLRTLPPVSVPSAMGNRPAATPSPSPTTSRRDDDRCSRIARRRPRQVEARPADGELVRRELAHDDGARAAQLLHADGVGLGDVVLEDLGMAGRGQARDVDDVLDADRHAMQRPAQAAGDSFGLGRLRQPPSPLRHPAEMKALSLGSSLATRSSKAFVSSTGDSSLSAMACAASAALSHCSSPYRDRPSLGPSPPSSAATARRPGRSAA